VKASDVPVIWDDREDEEGESQVTRKRNATGVLKEFRALLANDQEQESG
jgi:hypothetical protein